MKELIEKLTQEGTLHTPELIEAFRANDRNNFIPTDAARYAYLDQPIQIGYEQTISQPSTVAFMLELLGPKENERILDVGTGSGWTTALLAHVVGKKGGVIGIERIPELVAFGSENLVKYTYPQASIERAGTELGAPAKAPFDRILVSAAARTFPHELVSQLREGGVMVIPVRDAIWRVVRIEHQPVIEKFDGYIFVPLITE